MSGLSRRLDGWINPFMNELSVTPIRIRQAALEIDGRLSGVARKAPATFDLDQSHRLLLASIRNGNRLRDLDRRTLKHAPWLMFEPRDGFKPLAENVQFVDAYIERLLEAASGTLVTGFVYGLLVYYPARLATFQKLCLAAKLLLSRCTSQRCRRLNECVERLGLLEADGPARVWSWYCERNGEFDARLQGACVSGGLEQSGFMRAVFELALSSTRAGLGSDGFAEKDLVSLLSMATAAGSHDLRFKASQTTLVEALLLPCSKRKLDERITTRIEEFVLRLYGDPRVDRSRWQGVDEAAVMVVLEWLVEDTLEDFFRLLEHLAQGDPVATRHWRYRKAFWTAYLKAGVIQDAWVVLGPSIAGQAERILGEEGKAFGRLAKSHSVKGNHAALIMRIGKLVITEWSHNGRYRVWDTEKADRLQVPTPYQAHYTRLDLVRNATLEGAHAGSENGRWQKKVAGHIRGKTGISVRFKEYMPR